MGDEVLLSVRGLKTHFETYEGTVQAIDGIDLDIERGQTVGLVGETGCGKSVTALSILRLVPDPPGKIVAGAIRFKGRDLIGLTDAELRGIRGNQISMIFQEPMTALNPAFRIGEQIAESLLRHQAPRLTRAAIEQLEREVEARKEGRRASPVSSGEEWRCSACQAPAVHGDPACAGCGASFRGFFRRLLRPLGLRWERRALRTLEKDPEDLYLALFAYIPGLRGFQRRLERVAHTDVVAALRSVRIPEPDRIAAAYPFELSGGMRQRAMIAMMMACKPDLLIADEPTTALDVTVEAQILELMRELQKSTGTAILLITHDLGIIAENCQAVGVMYAGTLAEFGSAETVFGAPAHPYTHGLLQAIPKIAPGERTRRRRLFIVPGTVPNLLYPPPGCRFHPRCPYADDQCSDEVPLLRELRPGHLVACHHPIGKEGS